MSSSMLIVVLVVAAVLLYLLLRRRGGAPRGAIRTLPVEQKAEGVTEAEIVRPYRPAAGERTGLPPRGPVPDSSSSHPAYPVAPAKYAGAPAGWTEAATRPESDSGARRAAQAMQGRGDAGEAAGTAGAPEGAQPWYPEAPASYTEDGREARRSDPTK